MKASKEHKPQQSRVIPNYTHPIQKVSNKEKLEFYQMCDLAYIMAYNARNNVDYNTRFFLNTLIQLMQKFQETFRKEDVDM